MTDRLLDFVANNGNWYFENMGEALIYALIGFLIVFLGISLIILIIWLLGLVLRKTNNLAFMRGWAANLRAKRSKKNAESAETAVETAEDDGEVPAEVKAAIVAAIMAYYSKSAPECEFKVKRIKRI